MAGKPENTGKDRASPRFGTRLWVRYSLPGGSWSKSKVLDLSGAGVRFLAVDEPDKGACLDLELMFPGEPLAARGRVVRVIPAEEGGKRVFDTAAAFVGLDEHGREKIDMWFYSEKLDAPRGGAGSRSERRRSERFDVTKAYAEFRKRRFFPLGEWSRGPLKQVSRHGALLLVNAPLNYGDVVEMLLYLPAYPEPVRAIARVVRVRSRESALPARYPREVGFEFARVKKADIAKLSEDEYLQGLLGRSDSEFI